MLSWVNWKNLLVGVNSFKLLYGIVFQFLCLGRLRKRTCPYKRGRFVDWSSVVKRVGPWLHCCNSPQCKSAFLSLRLWTHCLSVFHKSTHKHEFFTPSTYLFILPFTPMDILQSSMSLTCMKTVQSPFRTHAVAVKWWSAMGAGFVTAQECGITILLSRMQKWSDSVWIWSIASIW